MKIELNDANLFLYAAKHYYSPLGIDAEEFNEDLNRFKYIKRLVNRYLETGQLSDRLILNHLIVIFNVFGIEAALNITMFKMDDKQMEVIKPFLLFLKYIRNDQLVDISMDRTAVEALRKI
jgi:hypothetical protein